MITSVCWVADSTLKQKEKSCIERAWKVLNSLSENLPSLRLYVQSPQWDSLICKLEWVLTHERCLFWVLSRKDWWMDWWALTCHSHIIDVTLKKCFTRQKLCHYSRHMSLCLSSWSRLLNCQTDQPTFQRLLLYLDNGATIVMLPRRLQTKRH